MARRGHGNGRFPRELKGLFKPRPDHLKPAKAGEGRRRALLEPLEPRLLLSADLSAAAEAAILQGFPSLSLWAQEELENLEEFSQLLPLLNDTLGSLVDVSQIIQDNLVAPVTGYVDDAGTQTSAGLASALKTFLQALDAGNDVVDLSTTERLAFQVTFHFDTTAVVELSLGSNPFGVEFAEGSTLNATVGLDFNFVFGVDLTAGLAPSEAFFIEVEPGSEPVMSASAAIDIENASFDFKVGMLEASASDVDLQASATIDATLADPNGDGMLTRAEWEGTPVSSIVSLSAGPTSSAVTGSVEVEASLGTYTASGMVTISDENLFDSDLPDIGFTGPQDLQDFSNITPGALVQMLNDLGASLQGVSSSLNPTDGLPLVGDTLNQLTSFADLMADLAGGFFDIELSDASSYKAPSAGLADGDLADNAVISLLKVVTIAADGSESLIQQAVNITLTPGDVSAAAGATMLAKAANALQAKINATALNGHVTVSQDGTFFTLSAADSDNRLVLRYEGDDRGMRQLGFTPKLANADFRFDSVQGFLDLLEDEVREVFPAFVPNAEYNANSELTFDLEWKTGFSGELPLDFTRHIDLPGGLGELAITGEVMGSASAEAFITARLGLDLSPLGGSFTATEATTLASLNVQDKPASDDLKITLRDGTVFMVDVEGLVDLGDVIQEIEEQSGLLMDGITPKVNVSIIPDDPGTLAREDVGLQLVDNTTGAGLFKVETVGSGADSSLAGLGLRILGSDVDGDGKILGAPLHNDTLFHHAFVEDGAELSASVEVTAQDINLTASLGFLEAGIVNGQAGFKISGGVTLEDPGGDGKITFDELSFNTAQSKIVGDPGVANGQLGSDATFSINVNGLGAVAVTVTAASTSGNATLADLVLDLNAALDATPFTSPDYDGTPFEGETLGDFINAGLQDGRLTLSGNVNTMAISAANGQASMSLGFADGDMGSSSVVAPTLSVMGTVDGGDPDLAAVLPIAIKGLEAFGVGLDANVEITGDTAASDGLLPGDAVFAVSLDGLGPVTVTVTAASTADNTNLGHLVDDLNDALDAASFTSAYDNTKYATKKVGDFVEAAESAGTITLTAPANRISISATNAETNAKLGFQDGDADMSPDTRIELDIAANSPISLNPSLEGLDASALWDLLAPFENFSLASLLELAEQMIDFIRETDLGIFSEPFPLVNVSVKDMLKFLDPILEAYDSVKEAVTGFKADALQKVQELGGPGGALNTVLTDLAAGGHLDLRDRLVQAVDALTHGIQELPDSLSDVLDFPSSPEIVSALVTAREVLADIVDQTSVSVDSLKKEIALIQNTIPSATTIARFLFNLTGLDELAGFDLEALFDQQAALRTALDTLKATEASDAIKATFDAITQDLDVALVERLTGGTDFTDADVSDWSPSAVLGVISRLQTALSDLQTEIDNIGDPDNDNEEAARDAIKAVLDILESALPAGLEIDFLENGGDKGIIFRFQLNKELLDESHSFDFSITEGPDIIPFGVKAGGTFEIDLGLALNIGFGLDFSDLSDIGSAFFLTGDSFIQATALINAPVSASVTIGGITAEISGDLTVQKDVDDMVTDDPAVLKVSLGGMATDRVTLGSIMLDLSESMGELKATLDAHALGMDFDDALVVTVDLTDFSSIDFQLNIDLADFQLDLTAIVQMIEVFLGFLADGLKSELMSKLPLVGDDFSEAGTFIEDIRNQITTIRERIEMEIDPNETVDTAIEQILTDILNETLGNSSAGLVAGLGLITITELDIQLPNGGNLIDDPDAAVVVRFQIGASDPIGAGFDAKLPALGLISGDIGVDIMLTSTIDFGVKVTKTDGASFLLNADENDPEVELGIAVSVKPDVVLDLFFLQLAITDGSPGVPELEVSAGINLSYGMGATEVPILDIDLGSFAFDPSFTTEVNLDLMLEASTDLIPNLPTLTAHFLLEWMFDIDDPENLSNLTYVAFEDISLNLGEFLAGPVGEIFQALNDFIDPVRPLLDFLTAEVPLISQVSQLIGLGPFTFLDGIRLLGEGGDTVATVIEIIDSIADAVGAVQATDTNVSVNFGDYILVDNRPGPLLSFHQNLDVFNEATDLTSALGTNHSGEDLSNTPGLFDTLGADKDMGGQGMLGISFPLLDNPAQIVNLLFGKPVDLVVWDVPRLEAGFEFGQIFGPIIPPFPVYARIAGAFGIFADFLVGLDTRGLMTGNFLEGLFFGDRTPTTPQGEDVPELGVFMEFTAGAELNIAFARAGVEGGVRAEINANWNDPNEDGKFYIDEVFLQASRGPECIFDLEGALTAFLRAYLKIEIPLGFTSITIVDVDFTILDVTLFDFSLSCPPLPPPIPAHLSNGGSGSGDPDTWNGDTTTLPGGTTLTKDATTLESGTLIIHAGSFSDLRQPGANDIADDIKIRGEGEFDGEDGFAASTYGGSDDEFDGGQVSASQGNGVVVDVMSDPSGVPTGDIVRDDLNNDGMNTTDVILVEAYGVTHVYTGVQRIIVDAGNNDEDDTIIIDPSVRVNVTVLAGGGDDEIQTGSGHDEVLGGAGEDEISTGTGNDRVKGGDDNDTIFGNAGGDTLDGEGGDDTIYGGDNDHVDMGDVADAITGGLGNDRLYGALGGDTISGNEGSDQIHGGQGADSLFGGADDDQIFGDEDADFPSPSDGTGQGDYIEGNGGNDQVIGGLGDDRLIGGSTSGSSDGGDLMVGGSGDDVMLGDNGEIGSVTLAGGSGNDTMVGGDGDDEMYGQGGADLMYGDGAVDTATTTILPDAGMGADYMEGNAGADSLYGGALDDRMIGGSSVIPASGLDSSDLMYGGDGSDIMLGDNGTITGTAGSVATNALGGSGFDTMFGGSGDDVLFGGGRDDRLSGSVGNDILVGDQGTRNSTMITADHSAEANSSGHDILSGSEGHDTMLGGEGDDQIAGDAGVDIAVGDNGKVTLTGGVPTQIETKEFAFGGADIITGSTSADILLGGSGSDLISGGGDTADDILLGDNGVVRDNNASMGDDNDIFSNDPAGAADTMDGGPGNDIMLGGTGGDTMLGGSGDDLMLGDHGNIERNAAEQVRFVESVFGMFLGKSFAGAGGADIMSGQGGTDLAMGGQDGDTIYGDAATPGSGDDRDILLGDNGEITLVDPLGGGAGPGLDAIVTFGGAVATVRTTDETAAEGGSDQIHGNATADVMAGGVVGDTLHGNDGDDIALGDNALIEWLYAGGHPGLEDLEEGFVFDSTFTTLDLVLAQVPAAHPGGRDTVFGDAGSDILMGGEDADTVWGDDGDESGAASDNDDILFGDHGVVYPQHSALPGFPSRNFFSVETAAGDAGEGDRLFGEEGNDLLLGQQGDDRLFGGDDDDDLIGGHNVSGGIDELAVSAVSASLPPQVNDVLDGGQGDDALAGDNAEIWRKATGTSPRFRALTGTTIYDPLAGPAGATQVTGDQQLDPRGSVGRDILLLDHTAALQGMVGSRPWGSDVMAGGLDHDALFGGLGDDLMQGDGSIDDMADALPGPSHMITFTDSGLPSTAGILFMNVAEAAEDGDDYLEGNGGSDLMYGNLGQDDMVGGSSALFGLVTGDQRPDGTDIMFGGAGTPARLARNAFTDSGDLLIDEDDRHAHDADVLAGDNASIFRLVGTNGNGTGAFLAFNYDALDPERGSLRVVPRGVDLHDYIRGVGDTLENGVEHGASDTIHGESGDDIIHGMIGTDLLYGEAEDDDILGGSGHDWATGGTGEDGILGDDGFLFTSRNGDPGEPLYGIAAIPASQLDQFIKTPGGIHQAILNVSGQLKKSVNLEPFGLGFDDILYGGLGDDALHGGAGDDAISGAEALPISAALVGGARLTIDYFNPVNPGNVLGFEAFTPDEFALYDEFDALRKIELDANGDLVKGPGQPGPFQEFLLNFEAFTDALDQTGTMVHDGNDVLFGDDGNDWLVGGTDQDHAFGGYGADLINLDDNHATNGGLNDQPDVPAFAGTSTIAGQLGADTGFGGAGRDVLIANTGGDRLIDWVGEYNAYLVPFAPFGEFTVTRNLQPQLPNYLYALSESDGTDQTRAFDTGEAEARNGEPFGELGLVLQQDDDWQDQTGAPDDPQAGNIPGGKRDVQEAADFSGLSSQFAVVNGTWSVLNGLYQATAPDTGDAVSLRHQVNQTPAYFEVYSTINVKKGLKGVKQNGYVIFDYQSETDFKFAGIDVNAGRMQVGQRTEAGWEVRSSVAVSQLRAGTNYDLKLIVTGQDVYATLVGKLTLITRFAQRFVDGVPVGLSAGMVGLGTDGSRSTFDNFRVDVLAPVVKVSVDPMASLGAKSGQWSPAGTSYIGFASTGQPPAVSTFGIQSAPLSFIDYSSLVFTENMAGLVFDYHGQHDYKFAALKPGSRQVIIGHAIETGVVYDAVVSANLKTNSAQKLGLSIKGGTVNVLVDGQFILSRSYATLLSDGGLGVLSDGGTSSFGTMRAKSEDTGFRVVQDSASGLSSGELLSATSVTVEPALVSDSGDGLSGGFSLGLPTVDETLSLAQGVRHDVSLAPSLEPAAAVTGGARTSPALSGMTDWLIDVDGDGKTDQGSGERLLEGLGDDWLLG
ncbi:MAG TPA: LEPR-XLL domain-containing protein [Candidatus Polarisedimenticolia bacterium]|nr:LEPR-XLL domain-containing protein [Candidatus Polarisedimenticolia bacterium]